jgi:IS30 family transposase
VGVNRKTGVRWKNGRRYTNRAGETWVYPPVASPEKLAEPPSGRFLSEFERIRIADLLRVRSSFREIARQLGRSSGTISREVNRNSDADGVYHPHAAHRAAVERRARPQERKLADGGELRRFVSERLAKRWSPEQISQALRVEFPDRDDMYACAETIYQAIYDPDSLLRRCSPRPLRTGRLRRHHHRQGRRTNRFVEPMTMIDQRPVEVEDRETPGHWEGDLIIGQGNRSAIGTLVERTTRFTILVHLNRQRSAEYLRDALIAAFLQLPRHLRRSLTWDQGIEMACHGEFSRAIGMPVYFCNPASPWQRGTNENTNGLLRDYFPKSTDLFQHDAERLAEVALELNHRPRRTLQWSTPAALLATFSSNQ